MLGKALNVLRNHIRVKYEKNVLRIKRSLLTQVTLLAENLLPEVAALLSSLLVGLRFIYSGRFPLTYRIFPSSSEEKGAKCGRGRVKSLDGQP